LKVDRQYARGHGYDGLDPLSRQVAHSADFLAHKGPRQEKAGHEGSAKRLSGRKVTPTRPVKLHPKHRLVPVRHAPKPIELEMSHLEDAPHHRWMLTTCIAGIAATLMVGGLILGHNTAPPPAYASTQESTLPPSNSALGAPDLTTASAPAKTANEPKTEVKVAAILPERDLQNDFSYPEITQDELPYGSGDQPQVMEGGLSQPDDDQPDNSTTITKTPPPEPVDEQFALTENRTIEQELMSRGVSRDAAEAMVAAIDPIMPQRMIKFGTEFTITFDRQIDYYGREVIYPVELSFKPGPKESITIEADEDGQFAARVDGKATSAKSQYAEVSQFHSNVRVGSSLYGTAKDNLIPEYIVNEFTRVFSYDVDFQRQIQASDSFEVFFGAPLSGSSSKRKVLHYAELNYNGITKAYYRFTSDDGQTDYYDESGRSASRSLLKTPISGARLTSGFGMRKHPLLGYTKMHAGVDFGAAWGTPIRAAGAGIVSLAGGNGSYGNTVIVQHTQKYKSLYAHMSRIAQGLRPGAHINQGQIIGYVGSTGRSTGPHLHYEVRINDRPVNPTTINATGGKQLAGADLRSFKMLKQRVQAMMMTAPSAVQVAQAGQ
jgi:murein DD-endopeptidase MepM/ murein hydrolase activator NlpD